MTDQQQAKAAIRRNRWKAKKGKVFLKEYFRDYQSKNRESISKRFKELKPRYKEKDQAYRDSRKDRKAAYDRGRYLRDSEHAKKRVRAWQKKNPEKFLAMLLKRRALKRVSAVNLKAISRFVALVKSKPFAVCYWCSKSVSTFGGRCHFDHIVPLSKGGPHSVENLCTSCASCNCSKQDKDISAWVRIGQQFIKL